MSTPTHNKPLTTQIVFIRHQDPTVLFLSVIWHYTIAEGVYCYG